MKKVTMIVKHIDASKEDAIQHKLRADHTDCIIESVSADSKHPDPCLRISLHSTEFNRKLKTFRDIHKEYPDSRVRFEGENSILNQDELVHLKSTLLRVYYHPVIVWI